MATSLAPKDYFAATFHANDFREDIAEITQLWQSILSWAPLRFIAHYCYRLYLLCIVSPLLWFYLNGPNFSFFGWKVGGWAGKSLADICAQMTPTMNSMTWQSTEALHQECSLMVFREFHAFVVGILSAAYITILILLFCCLSRTFQRVTHNVLFGDREQPHVDNPHRGTWRNAAGRRSSYHDRVAGPSRRRSFTGGSPQSPFVDFEEVGIDDERVPGGFLDSPLAERLQHLQEHTPTLQRKRSPASGGQLRRSSGSFHSGCATDGHWAQLSPRLVAKSSSKRHQNLTHSAGKYSPQQSNSFEVSPTDRGLHDSSQ